MIVFQWDITWVLVEQICIKGQLGWMKHIKMQMMIYQMLQLMVLCKIQMD